MKKRYLWNLMEIIPWNWVLWENYYEFRRYSMPREGGQSGEK
jgi:hypothetical protein